MNSQLNRTKSRVILLLFLVAALTAFLVIYSVLTPAAVGGGQGGSDRDEALQEAVTGLLSGVYPYGSATYLGNPVTPLPGSLLLHVPTQLLLGSTVYTEPLMLIAACLLVNRIDFRAAAVLALALGGQLSFWQDFLTGGDYATSSIFLLRCSCHGGALSKGSLPRAVPVVDSFGNRSGF